MSRKRSTDQADRRRRYQQRIRQFSRVRRGLANATLGYRLGIVIPGLGILLLLLAGIPLNAPLVDAALFALAALLLLTMAARYLWRRQRFKGDLFEAFRMENLVGGLNSRLISALDFLDQPRASPLTEVVIAAAGRDLEETPFEARLDRSARARARFRFLGVLALMLLLGATPWLGFGHLAARARAAWFEVCERLFPTEWELLPGAGRHVYLLGERVEVALRFTRNGFEKVVMIQDDPEHAKVGRIRTLLPVAQDDTARTVLQGDARGARRIVFEFGHRARRTEPIEVVFTTRPVIENMQIGITPPFYTRQPPRDLVGVQTRIAGLPGTRVSLGLIFSKRLKRATVRFEGDDQDVPLEVSGRFATLEFVLAQSRNVRIQIEDLHGFALLQPHTLNIDLLVDEPPRFVVPKFLKEEMPFTVGQARSFGFPVRAWDDYGVTRVVLKWKRMTDEDRNAVEASGVIERPSVPPLTTVVSEFLNAFSEQKLEPGHVLSFHIEVTDNRDPNAQLVSSPTYSFYVHQGTLGGGALGGGAGLMFGEGEGVGGSRSRLARHRESTEVPQPQDIRGVSNLTSDYEAAIQTDARAPAVNGDFGPATQKYFKVLSSANFLDHDEDPVAGQDEGHDTSK